MNSIIPILGKYNKSTTHIGVVVKVDEDEGDGGGGVEK